MRGWLLRDVLLLTFSACALSQRPLEWDSAFGPINSDAVVEIPEANQQPLPNAGWAVDHHDSAAPEISADGTLKITGDTRAYLVHDHRKTSWHDTKYVRIDMSKGPLEFTLDLSNVPCGCLACVYLVEMKDPDWNGPNYCDMAENVYPGLDNGPCTEYDILEANNAGMQTAIHTETGGGPATFGKGMCDRNGCFTRTGSPTAPDDRQDMYGLGDTIDSNKPFDVRSSVDEIGQMTIELFQGSKSITTFDKRIAGEQMCLRGSCAHSMTAMCGHAFLLPLCCHSPAPLR